MREMYPHRVSRAQLSPINVKYMTADLFFGSRTKKCKIHSDCFNPEIFTGVPARRAGVRTLSFPPSACQVDVRAQIATLFYLFAN